MAVFLFLRSLALRGLHRRFEIGANPSGCRSRSLAIPQNRQNRIKRCGAVACRLEYLPHHDLSAAIGWAPATVRNWYARQVHKEPAYERGALYPAVVGTVLPLEDAHIAHEMLAGRPHRRGKIVLDIDS
jgi:hypothetical protein